MEDPLFAPRCEIRTAFKQWLDEVRSLDVASSMMQPRGFDGFMFFGFLSQSRKELLEFPYAHDKWQAVHSMLLHYPPLVSD